LGRAAIDSDEALEVRKHTFARTVPDYEDVVGQVHVPLPPHVAQYLRTAASGPAVGYYLAKRRDVLDWVLGLAPWRALETLTYLARTLEFEQCLGSIWLGWPTPLLEHQTIAEIQAAMDLARLYICAPVPGARPH
jgi:hypothetical protein